LNQQIAKKKIFVTQNDQSSGLVELQTRVETLQQMIQSKENEISHIKSEINNQSVSLNQSQIRSKF